MTTDGNLMERRYFPRFLAIGWNGVRNGVNENMASILGVATFSKQTFSVGQK